MTSIIVQGFVQGLGDHDAPRWIRGERRRGGCANENGGCGIGHDGVHSSSIVMDVDIGWRRCGRGLRALSKQSFHFHDERKTAAGLVMMMTATGW